MKRSETIFISTVLPQLLVHVAFSGCLLFWFYVWHILFQKYISEHCNDFFWNFSNVLKDSRFKVVSRLQLIIFHKWSNGKNRRLEEGGSGFPWNRCSFTYLWILRRISSVSLVPCFTNSFIRFMIRLSTCWDIPPNWNFGKAVIIILI